MQFRGPGDDGDDEEAPDRDSGGGSRDQEREPLRTAPPDEDDEMRFVEPAAGSSRPRHDSHSETDPDPDPDPDESSGDRGGEPPGFPPGWESVNARRSRAAARAGSDRDQSAGDAADRQGQPRGGRSEERSAHDSDEDLEDLFGERTSLEEALDRLSDGGAQAEPEGGVTSGGQAADRRAEPQEGQSAEHPEGQSAKQSAGQSAEHPEGQSAKQSAGQPAEQSAGQPDVSQPRQHSPPPRGEPEPRETVDAAAEPTPGLEVGSGDEQSVGPAARAGADSSPEREVGVLADRAHRTGPGADTRWWYGVAALPLSLVVAAPLLAVLIAGGSTFDAMGLGVYAWALASSFGFVFVALPGVLAVTLFPVSLYLDASLVAADPAVDWEPDAALYGILGLVGLVAAGVGALLLALLYLHRRHRAVGRP